MTLCGCEGAENGLQIVDVFGKRGIGEGFLDAGLVERDFDGEVIVDGEAEAAGRILSLSADRSLREDGAPGFCGGCCRRGSCSRLAAVRASALVVRGFGGDLFGDGLGVFEDGDGQAVGLAWCRD